MELLYISLYISLLFIVLFTIFEEEYTIGEYIKMFILSLIPVFNCILLSIIIYAIFENYIKTISKWLDKPLKKKK